MGGAAGSEGVLCAATSEEVAARLAGRDAQTAGAAATRRHLSPTYCISFAAFHVLFVSCTLSQGPPAAASTPGLTSVLSDKK